MVANLVKRVSGYANLMNQFFSCKFANVDNNYKTCFHMFKLQNMSPFVSLVISTTLIFIQPFV